jgi:hypothetical protein
MGGIFISYRRNDSGPEAGRLRDALIRHFGANQVFRDRDSITPGERVSGRHMTRTPIDDLEERRTPRLLLARAACLWRATGCTGSFGSVEGGAGPSRLLVRGQLHRKGFTAVDTLQFNGDGPGSV